MYNKYTIATFKSKESILICLGNWFSFKYSLLENTFQISIPLMKTNLNKYEKYF